MRSSFINSSGNNFSPQSVNPGVFQSVNTTNVVSLRSPGFRNLASNLHSCVDRINKTIDSLVKILSLTSTDEVNESFLRDILIVPLLNKVTEKLYVLSDYVTEQGCDHLENEISSCLGIVQSVCTILKRNNIGLNDQDLEISHHLYNLNIEFETFTQIIGILEQNGFENFDLSEDIIHDFHIALKNLSQTILDRCHSHKAPIVTSMSAVDFV